MLLFTLFFFLGSLIKDKEQPVFNNPIGNNNFSMQVNEELIYEVSYAFVKLGKIKIKTLNQYDKNGKKVYKAIAFMDSYNIPLISLHNVFETEMDEAVYSHQFIGSELEKGNWKYTKYDFDYNLKKVFWERGFSSEKKPFIKDVLSLDNKEIQDGLSLFFKARELLYSQSPQDIPVLVNEKKEVASIQYPCKRETVEIDAVKYLIDVLYFKGKATFVGVLGLTGDFQGWFSNDSARIPVFAKMNVIFGSVKVELISWKGINWDPPKKVN
jgi:hypothetical protein